MSWKDGVVVPDVRLTNEQLRGMTPDEVWAVFEPYMGPLDKAFEWVRFSDVLRDSMGFPIRRDEVETVSLRKRGAA